MKNLNQRIVERALGGPQVNATAEELAHELEAMSDDERDALTAAVLRMASQRIRTAGRLCEWLRGVRVEGEPLSDQLWFGTGEALMREICKGVPEGLAG